MTTFTPALERSLPVVEKAQKPRVTPGRAAAQVFMISATILWFTPIAWAMYTSLRSYNETSKYGYLSLPHHLTFVNFRNAFDQGNMVHFFWNSVIVTVPAVIITLFFASSRRVRVVALQVLVQHSAADHLRGRQSVASAGADYAAVPHLSHGARADVHQ